MNTLWTLRILRLCLLLALILSGVSMLGLCTQSCSEAHQWRFFDYGFDLLGIAFFSSALVLSFMQWHRVLHMLLSSALGAELVFIYIQKEVIGSFCPVCLSIAACVLVAWLANRRFVMGKCVWCTSLSSFILGILLVILGAGVPEKSFADHAESPIFGNPDSSIEIYIVSDWFCPSCKELEPVYASILEELQDSSRIFFIDYPLNPESLNFLPYNVSFMLREKSKYLELRKALATLTQTTTTPQPQQVAEAIKPLHVEYSYVNFSDVESALRYFRGIQEAFDIRSTPTVVIANRDTRNAKKLLGKEEITLEEIHKTIESLE